MGQRYPLSKSHADSMKTNQINGMTSVEGRIYSRCRCRNVLLQLLKKRPNEHVAEKHVHYHEDIVLQRRILVYFGIRDMTFELREYPQKWR